MNAQPGASTAETVLVVGNPYSGSGANRRRVAELQPALEAEGLRVRTAWTLDERCALLSDPALASWCRCVVSAGGDGTLAGVVNEMARRNSPEAGDDAAGHAGGAAPRAESVADRAGGSFTMPEVPLATLPVGTENLFARQFGFTDSPARLAAAVARGHTCQVDLGAVGDRLFTLMASAGFDADVVHRLARWRSAASAGSATAAAVTDAAAAASPALRRVSRLSYVNRILGTAREYAYPPITLEVDGERVTGSHVFVFNIPQYGANLGICRHACCDDATLDWVVFKNPGLRSLAAYGLSVIRSRHLHRSDVVHGQAHTLRLIADEPSPIQADGDPAGWTPLAVDIRPAALRVVTP